MRFANAALILAAAGAGAWLLRRVGGVGHFDFRGKVAVVTGGSRGLGLVLARELTDRGARVAICARNDEDIDRAAQDLAGRGGNPLAAPCDITRPDEVAAFVRAVEAHLGPVDVLINNAGTIAVGPLEAMTRDDYEQAMGINFWGAYNFVEAVLPSMRQRRAGRIVNISSIGGKVAVPHLLPYCASKFALTGYSHGLRAELLKDGVVVTTVCPGLMRTGSPPNVLVKGQHRKEYAWFAISDSLSLLTLSAESAARQVLAACQRGEAEAVLSLPAQAAVTLHNLFPELSADLLSLVNRYLLPAPGGIGTEHRLGRDSESALAPSVLTASTEAAARRNNETGGREPQPGNGGS
jgi:NAD(P)-dependent dehydrogenase (short-subunit alcohol dehydrogenase family)